MQQISLFILMARANRKAVAYAQHVTQALREESNRLADSNRLFRVSLQERTGKSVMVYGQTEITADLYEARDAAGLQTIHEALGVAIRDPFLSAIGLN